MRRKTEQLYYKNNLLQQLRGFCLAAQYGNISRAAKHVNLTHSSVSLQIKGLEEDMNCALFHRNGPRITLTPEGRKLMEMALPLVEAMGNLRDEFHGAVHTKALSELHVAVNGTAKNYLMPAVVADYIAAHQTMRIVLHVAEHKEALELLKSNLVDLAILPRRDQATLPKTYDYTPVFHCKPCLITRADHPLAGRKNLTVEEIARHPLTLPSKELQVLPGLHEMFSSKIAKENLRVMFANAETGREYVEAGLVITISSDVWLRPDDTLVATPLTHLFPTVDYGFVRKALRPMPKKAQQFVDVMHESAAKRATYLYKKPGKLSAAR